MQILAISGSLRTASSNTAVLRAVQALAPLAVEVTLYDGMGQLPHFNPDLDHDDIEPPASVLDLRARVGKADGLLISSPEYAHGVPGSLKNALDWLVRSFEFPDKPVALIGASPRAVYATESLHETLRTMSARMIAEASVTLPVLSGPIDFDRIMSDPALMTLLSTALTAFVSAIALPRSEAL